MGSSAILNSEPAAGIPSSAISPSSWKFLGRGQTGGEKTDPSQVGQLRSSVASWGVQHLYVSKCGVPGERRWDFSFGGKHERKSAFDFILSLSGGEFSWGG